MMKFRGEFEVERMEPRPTPTREGVSSLRGSRLLPDPMTAALALLRGYRVGGVYDRPLEGAARELGYHPLSSATPEEWEEIQRLLSGGEA